MTDATAPADTAANGQTEPMEGQAPAGPGFRILAQYVRDLSFENPRAPDSLRIEGKPAIDMGVEMNAAGRPDGLFELDLKLSVKATGDDKNPVFHVELVYGGLFALSGVAPQDIEPMLLIECPRYLFPFARRIIADVTSDGGYPPFLLDPIDFAGVYAARKAQAEAEGVVIGNA